MSLQKKNSETKSQYRTVSDSSGVIEIMHDLFIPFVDIESRIRSDVTGDGEHGLYIISRITGTPTGISSEQFPLGFWFFEV